MYCKVCNKEIGTPENRVCPFCGNVNLEGEVHIQPNQGVTSYKPINQTAYLIFAILATVLCCVPLGIPAIVFAVQVGSAQEAGDYGKAEDCAKKAKIFIIVSAVLAVVVIIAYFLLIFFGVATGFNAYNYGY